MKCTQYIAYFKLPYKAKDKTNMRYSKNPELKQFYYHYNHLLMNNT